MHEPSESQLRIPDQKNTPEIWSRLRRTLTRPLSLRQWLLPLIAFGIVFPALLAWLTKPPTPIDFRKAEKQVYSQHGEDGVIEGIFSRIKPTRRFAVEFGAGDGVMGSNTRNLILHHSWSALLLEGDDKLAANAQDVYKDMPGVKAIHAWIFPGNVELLFEENGVPLDLDLLSIDVDSNDWYVWRAIAEFRPKVVVIEYNPGFMPPRKAVVDFHPMTYWDHTDYYGASLQSLYELGKKKGYDLVYCESSGANAFFVDRRYFKRFGIIDNSPRRLYQPAKYGYGDGGRGPGGAGWPNYEDPGCHFYNIETKKRYECPKTIPVDSMVIQKKWVDR